MPHLPVSDFTISSVHYKAGHLYREAFCVPLQMCSILATQNPNVGLAIAYPIMQVSFCLFAPSHFTASSQSAVLHEHGMLGCLQFGELSSALVNAVTPFIGCSLACA